MANLPLHAYRSKGENASRVGGKLQRIVNEAPNTQWTSYGMRKYLWQGVFGSAGRGCAWIERKGTSIEAICHLNMAEFMSHARPDASGITPKVAIIQRKM